MAKTARSPSVKRISDRDRYVVPNKSGGWDIVKAGHRRATGHAKTKAQAIDRARQVVRIEGGGEIRIMNKYGKLTDSNTVAPRGTRRK